MGCRRTGCGMRWRAICCARAPRWSTSARCCATTSRRAPRSTRNAPRGALLYPRCSREELEGKFLGPMAYPDPKGERNSSMPGKRRSGSGVRAEALRDPRDMAKAGLPESQSPEDVKIRPPERHLLPAPCSAMPSFAWLSQPSGCGALPSEGNQGDEWDAYVTLGRITGTNAGLPVGRQPHGYGVPIVVVGVATHQGGRESRPQGEGAQVAGHPNAGRYA